jgi:hypothetical protein
MYTLIINKSTKLIIQSRHDNATGEKMTPYAVLDCYCKYNNVDSSTLEVIEIPYTDFQIELGKHIYADGQISVDPTWIAPPRVETASIPVSGS